MNWIVASFLMFDVYDYSSSIFANSCYDVHMLTIYTPLIVIHFSQLLLLLLLLTAFRIKLLYVATIGVLCGGCRCYWIQIYQIAWMKKKRERKTLLFNVIRRAFNDLVVAGKTIRSLMSFHNIMFKNVTLIV